MNNPPSVLFVLPWSLSEAGGVNQVVIHLAREAARRERLRPIIFCVDPLLESFREEETEGIKLVRGNLLAPLSSEHPGRNLATFAHRLRDEKHTWRKFLQRHNVKVVNAHYPSLVYFVFALLQLRRAKIRLLFSLHGTDVTVSRNPGWPPDHWPAGCSSRRTGSPAVRTIWQNGHRKGSRWTSDGFARFTTVSMSPNSTRPRKMTTDRYW